MGITDQLGLLIDITVSKIPNIVAMTNNQILRQQGSN